ncbi:hypothetical protein Goklo_005899 [Gossypium klotzschianum]|uniref:Aminotransferase-like plant mobile domain-containing protein n=1 Tax=Gossypium klotzschianum TaxID=34286 RepID=A0A7J8VG57_9ROSI|nr:hypothetical protein [Gossypium klotzschianum]
MFKVHFESTWLTDGCVSPALRKVFEILQKILRGVLHETNTFHLPCGECKITFKDVTLQLDLPVDGLVIVGSAIVTGKVSLCQSLLGKDSNNKCYSLFGNEKHDDKFMASGYRGPDFRSRGEKIYVQRGRRSIKSATNSCGFLGSNSWSSPRGDGKKRPKWEGDKFTDRDRKGSSIVRNSPRTVRRLRHMLKKHNTQVVFFIETKLCKIQMERVRRSYDFWNSIDVFVVGSKGEIKGLPRDEKRMEAFRGAWEECQLLDVGYFGVWFTWEKGNLPETNIRERLDR